MRYRNLLITLGLSTLATGLLFSTDTVTQAFLHFLGDLLNNPLDEVFWGIGLRHAGIELILVSVSLFLFLLYFKKHPDRTITLISLAWVVLFLIYVLKDTVNIPFHDDYFFLSFLNEYADSGDISKIFSQDNESRLILMKSLSVLLYHLHAFNFKTLSFISVACLLGSSFILFRSVKLPGRHKLFLLLVLSITLFQFEYYDSIVWASGALYSSCTLFFAFASIYLLTSKMRYGYLPAILCSVLSLASCGIGFISLAIGMFILVSGKKIKESILWAVISATVFALYAYNYSFGGDHYHFGFSLGLNMGRILTCLIFSPAFLGSSVQFLYHIYLPAILGLFVWGTFIYSTYKKYYQKNPAIYYLLLFLVLTSLVPPLARKNIALIECINIRYGIYSIMAISACIVIWAESIREEMRNKFLLIALPLCLSFHVLSGIFFYPEVVLRKTELITMAKNFKRTNVIYMPPPYLGFFVPENSTQLMIDCREKNIYHLPER